MSFLRSRQTRDAVSVTRAEITTNTAQQQTTPFLLRIRSAVCRPNMPYLCVCVFVCVVCVRTVLKVGEGEGVGGGGGGG